MRVPDSIIPPAAALATGTFAWFASSSFLPFVREGGAPEYLLIGAPLSVFVTAAAAAFAIIATLVYRFRISPRAFAPLILLALLATAALNLLPGVSGRAPVLTYVVADLRWWWAALIVLAVARRIERDAGAPLRRRVMALRAVLSPAARLFALDAALFLLVIAWAVVSNTQLRFTSVVHGDEVKYLRYCENFYQGLGFEVEHQRTIDDLTLAYSPRIERNFVLVSRAIRDELDDMAADARALASNGLSFRFNRARYAEEWFIRGKHGDFYQVHNPGFAFVLFPAYLIDRHFISTSSGYQGRLPVPLAATNLLCLLLWAVWAVVVFRYLRAEVGRDSLAWLLAAMAMLVMPVGAFAFQIYPEAVAALVVFGVASALLARKVRSAGAACLGMAAGFLPWLHVRYLVLSIVLLAWALAFLRGRRRAFSAGFALLAGAMCLYAYHLTGSFRPDAMYQTEGSYSPWRVADALQSAVAYPFDRIWGVFAHAPVYLFALPGFVLAARKRPRATALAALLILALAGPSAGHGVAAAGSSPLRHLVAVIPFMMLPIAYTLMEWGHVRWVRVAFVLLLILSLDVGLSYNLHHPKQVGRLLDSNISGWSPNLLMPWTHADRWQRSTGNFALFVFWVVTSVTLVLLPLARRFQRAASPAPRARPIARAPSDLTCGFFAAVLLIAVGTVVTVTGGEPTRMDYFMPAEEARARSITYLATLDRCALCYSSIRGEVSRASLVGDTIEKFTFAPLTDGADESGAGPDRVSANAGEPMRFRARVTAREGAGWGTLAVGFGDNDNARVPNLFGHADVWHVYREPGLYRLQAVFTATGGSVVQRILHVDVRPTSVRLAEAEGLPDSVKTAPVRGAILEATRLGDRVAVRHNGEWTATEVHLLAWVDGRWHAMPAVSDAAALYAGSAVAIVAADGTNSGRTEAVVVDWPSPAAATGSPVVLYRAARAR